MNPLNKLSDEEFKRMINLLNRYVETEMDQWELWKFNTSFSTVYINISMKPEGSVEAYTDVSHLVGTE